jgi:hypothetical protein
MLIKASEVGKMMWAALESAVEEEFEGESEEVKEAAKVRILVALGACE